MATTTRLACARLRHALRSVLQVQDGLTMWSCTSWKQGEIERNAELRASRALEALEGWPDEVRSSRVWGRSFRRHFTEVESWRQKLVGLTGYYDRARYFALVPCSIARLSTNA